MNITDFLIWLQFISRQIPTFLWQAFPIWSYFSMSMFEYMYDIPSMTLHFDRVCYSWTSNLTLLIAEFQKLHSHSSHIHVQTHEIHSECIIFQNIVAFGVYIPSFHLRDNYVHVHECSPIWVGISTIWLKIKFITIVNMFEIVFSFNVKDDNIFLCLPHIRLSYNI